MNENQRAAFLQAQAACAIIEALAIVAAIIPDSSRGPGHPGTMTYSIPDPMGSIRSLIDKYGIGHNAALTFLAGD